MLLSTQWAFIVIERPLHKPGDITHTPKGLAASPLLPQIVDVPVPSQYRDVGFSASGPGFDLEQRVTTSKISGGIQNIVFVDQSVSYFLD